MKLSELMSGKTPNAAYAGFADNDDFVLAIDVLGTADSVGDYAVAQDGVSSHEVSVNSDTKDAQYIRTGKRTTKTGAQRTIKIKGDRYIGDDFQDGLLSLDMQFGVGASVVRKYVYFNILTGVGESGSLNLVVNDVQTGSAGESAGFSVDATSTATPVAYTYGVTAVAPVIGTQPANVTAATGTTATFTVVASASDGGVLTYQWQSSPDGTTYTNISGALSATYTTPALASGNNNSKYRVIVTNTINATSATVTSASATLTVN